VTTPSSDGEQKRGRRPRARGLLLRLAGSALLILLLGRFLDLDVDQITSRTLEPAWLVLGLAVLLAQTLVAAARWGLVVRGLTLQASRSDILRILLVGLFFNQTLPSSVGGDAVRVWQLRRVGNRGAAATTSVVLDRLIALLALLPLMVLGILRLADDLANGVLAPVLVLITVGTAAGSFVLLMLHRLPRRHLTGHATALRTMSAGADRLLRTPSAVVPAFALSVVIHLTTGVSVYLLARGLDVPLSLGDAIVLTPLVLLVTTVPVSFAGWGLREGAMVLILAMIGIREGDALTLSVAFGLSVMATGVPGGVLWLLSGRPTTFAPQATEEPAVPAKGS
jgi:uncharacterized protein (TIRG00374 family)